MSNSEDRSYVILWSQDSVTTRTDSINERSAHQICKQRSVKFGMSQFAAVVDGVVVEKTTYENGVKGATVLNSGEHVPPAKPDGIYVKPEPTSAHPVIAPAEPKQRRSKIQDGVKQPRPVETKVLTKLESRVKEAVDRVVNGPKEPKSNGEAEDNIALSTTSTKAIERSAQRKSAGLSADEVVAQFKPRNGTLRKKLLELMANNLDAPVSAVDMATVLYGEFKPQFLGPLKMVMKGVSVMIEKERLPYAVKAIKVGGEPAYALAVA